jgi:hypothetical protein
MAVLSSQKGYAEVRLYKYDGNMPFVKMMLNMMAAMGIIDKVPANAAYGLSGYPGLNRFGYNNLYSRYLYSRNPYLRALALRGIYPNNTNNPFVRSPWLNSPWINSGGNSASPVWGTPSWGVLPLDSYSSYRSPWTSYDLSGWVNEPWEESIWNKDAETEEESSQPVTPVVQNFNYHVTEENAGRNISPLRKLVPPKRSHRPSKKASKPARSSRRNEKPCITEFCGLKKPNLNGLWMAQNGEMLGVNDDRYLWSDGQSRYLSGQIKIQNEYLLTSIDDDDALMRFKYKLAGNHLITLRPDGTTSEFVRIPMSRYRGDYDAGGVDAW